MKKLLLASTAMVMSAGVAAADVALSGDARMGLIYDGTDVQMTSRARVTFTLSGETDTGLAFGASFRADNAGDASSGDAGSVFISGDFGRLSMGDVNSAANAIVGHISGVGLTGLGDLNESTYLGNNITPAALYEYSIDGFSFAASIDSFNAAGRVYSIAAGYSIDGLSAGLGYEKVNGGVSHLIGSVGYEMDGIGAEAIFGRSNGSNQYGLSVSGTFDATFVTAYGFRTFAGNTNYGIGASYDLGGGASIVGGVARDGAASNTIADFGLSFSF